MGRGRGGRNRKPRNSATFRLCPRPGAADPSDRVLVRVDGNQYHVPGLDDDDDDCSYFEGAIPSADDDGAEPSSSPSGAALPDHVRRAILELGLPDDGYNYLDHIREIRPSYSSTGGGGSSTVFLPTRRAARCGLPLSVKAYDARGVEVGLDNAAATGELIPVEEAIDPDVTDLLEEREVPPVPIDDYEGESVVVPLVALENEDDGTSEDEDDGTSEDEDDGTSEDEDDGTSDDEGEQSKVPTGSLEYEDEDSELEDDFVIIANQPEEEDQMDLEDDFVILANQPDEQMDTRLELPYGHVKCLLWERMLR
ncbi:acidic leucine-rich nuclear phosphoprotein 32-related protein 1-like isoform X1 [Hordeum vulgare subsp. vulgare]|uniref:Uncharacterized protein n=1 Tax=Hordeum vulgare subsp. vulgare TaxID=112509 RepID=A0A8I6WLG4_HORVV|nr:acidic leucine-rich nuclear phosphoprotein 32-related protein 1-like isoform X1 [Hordeum vulgare subsp. vulgare]